MRAVKFAIAIPQFFVDGEFDPAAYRSYFARAEELGFDSAWAQENMLGSSPQLSPLESMERKADFLTEAARERYLIWFYHETEQMLGYWTGEGFEPIS